MELTNIFLSSKVAAQWRKDFPIMAFKENLFKAFHEKHAVQRHVSRRFLFDVFQRLGFHITGDHFYEIVPNTRLIAEKYSEAARTVPGIDWRFADCERRALTLINRYGTEFCDTSTRFGFREKNLYFRGVDALMLYLILRDLKPAKLVEVGQGFPRALRWLLLRETLRKPARACVLFPLILTRAFGRKMFRTAFRWRASNANFRTWTALPCWNNAAFFSWIPVTSSSLAATWRLN